MLYVTIMIMNEKTKLKDIAVSPITEETESGVYFNQYEENGKRYFYFYKEVLLNINDLYMFSKGMIMKELNSTKHNLSLNDVLMMKNAIWHYLPERVNSNINHVNIAKNPHENYLKVHFGVKYNFSDIMDLSLEDIVNKTYGGITLNQISNNLVSYEDRFIDNINAEYLLNGVEENLEYDKEERI